MSFIPLQTSDNGSVSRTVINDNFIDAQSQIDVIIAAGVPLASASVIGRARLSTAPANASIPIAVGDNDSRLPSTDLQNALLGIGATPNSTNKFITQDVYGAVFGDGADGTVTISSPTTLTRDMYYDNLTVNSTLTTDGYRIFVRNTISGTGTIKTPDGNSGIQGGDGGASSNGGAGGAGFSGGVGTNTGGGAGGNGDSSSSGGTNNATNGVAGVNGYIGGNPGAPGAGTSGTNLSKQKYGIEKWSTLSLIETLSTSIVKRSHAGAGGGNGAGSASAGNTGMGGGGGGASGGIVIIFAKIWAGTFTISAIAGDGGRGGNATSGTTYGGNGGGGGAGGVSVVVYLIKTWTGTHTLTAGTGGAAGASFGTPSSGQGAAAGANGGAGVSYELLIGNLL